MSSQRGSVGKRHGAWRYRLYVNEAGRRVRKERGGFRTKGEATAALNRQLDNDRLGPELARELYPEHFTFDKLADEYVDQYPPEASSKKTLEHRLGYARTTFGKLELSHITAREVKAWRARLPKGMARGIHQVFRQTLAYAVDAGLLNENPAKKVPNPEARREEITPFDSWTELETIAAEIDPRWRAIPIFAAGTGLRPQEWIALERADIDRDELVVHVRRTYSSGALKSYGKTDRSRRRVPLRDMVLEALDEMPRRIDSKLLFPAAKGEHLDLNNWRRREWLPAFKAAEIDKRRIYDMRHTFATFAIAAGTPLYYLSRFMGTSVQMIDRTYGHLFSDAEAEVRDLLNLWDGCALGADQAESG